MNSRARKLTMATLILCIHRKITMCVRIKDKMLFEIKFLLKAASQLHCSERRLHVALHKHVKILYIL